MGQQIAGGLLLGLSRGFEEFRATKEQQRHEEREDQLFDIRRRGALLDIRQTELDIKRAQAQLEEERKTGIRAEDLHDIERRIGQANAGIAERKLLFEQTYGDRLDTAKLKVSEHEVFEAGLRAQEAQIRLDVATVEQQDFEARRAEFPPEMQARFERERLSHENKLNNLQRALQQAEHDFNMTSDADGVTPLEKQLTFNLEMGELEIEERQFRKKTRLADLLLQSDDPKERRTGLELFKVAASESDPEIAEFLSRGSLDRPEGLGVERSGGTLASRLLGLKPTEIARRKFQGEESAARVEKLRKLDQFARRTFEITGMQALRDILSGPTEAIDRPLRETMGMGSPLARFFLQESTDENSQTVFDPDKGRNVDRIEFTFELDPVDKDRLLRQLAEEAPEEFGKYQSLPEHEQRIFLARTAAKDPELRKLMATLPPEDLSLGTMALGVIPFAGRIPMVARGLSGLTSKASSIPFLGNLIKSAPGVKPPPISVKPAQKLLTGPVRTPGSGRTEIFPRRPSPATTGPPPQLPAPPPKPILQQLIEGPPQRTLLGPQSNITPPVQPGQLPGAPIRDEALFLEILKLLGQAP